MATKIIRHLGYTGKDVTDSNVVDRLALVEVNYLEKLGLFGVPDPRE